MKARWPQCWRKPDIHCSICSICLRRYVNRENKHVLPHVCGPIHGQSRISTMGVRIVSGLMGEVILSGVSREIGVVLSVWSVKFGCYYRIRCMIECMYNFMKFEIIIYYTYMYMCDRVFMKNPKNLPFLWNLNKIVTTFDISVKMIFSTVDFLNGIL